MCRCVAFFTHTEMCVPSQSTDRQGEGRRTIGSGKVMKEDLLRCLRYFSSLPAATATATLQEAARRCKTMQDDARRCYRLSVEFFTWTGEKNFGTKRDRHSVEDEVGEEERDTRWDLFFLRILLEGMNCSWMCLCVFSSQNVEATKFFSSFRVLEGISLSSRVDWGRKNKDERQRESAVCLLSLIWERERERERERIPTTRVEKKNEVEMQSSAKVKMHQKRYVFVGVTDVEVEVGGKSLLGWCGNSGNVKIVETWILLQYSTSTVLVQWKQFW